MRKLEVIDQLEKKGGQTKQFLDDRIRAATRTFIEAEQKAGSYGKALVNVYDLVPSLSKEVANLAQSYQKQINTEKEAAALEQKKANRREEIINWLKRWKANEDEITATNKRREKQILSAYVKEQIAASKLEEKQKAIAASMPFPPDIMEKMRAQQEEIRKNTRKTLQVEKQIAEERARVAKEARKLERQEYVGIHKEQVAIANAMKDHLQELQMAIERRKQLSAAMPFPEDILQQARQNAVRQREIELQNEKNRKAYRKLEREEAVAAADRERKIAAEMLDGINEILAKAKERKAVEIGIAEDLIRLGRERAIENKKLAAEEIAHQKIIEQLKTSFRRREVQEYVDEQLRIQQMEIDFENKMESLRRAARRREVDEYVQGVLEEQAAERRLQQEIERLKQSARARERKAYVDAFEANKKLQSMVIQPQQHALLEQIRLQEQQNALIARRMNMYRQMPSLMARGTPGGGFGQQAMQGLSMAGIPGTQLLGMGAIGASIYAGSKLILESVKAYARLRDNLVLLEVQFKSTEKAAIAFNQIRQLAAESPLESADLLRAAKMLAQYGVAAEDVTPTLRRLAEISSGNAMQLEGLARAYAQVRGAGRLMGQELLQLTNAGFNPLREITRMTGVEMMQLRKMMEQGLLTFKDFDDAVYTSTSTLHKGQFAGQMTKQAEELSAQFNAFSDALTQVGEQIGSMLAPYIKMFLKDVTENLRAFAKALQILTQMADYTNKIFFDRDKWLQESTALLVNFATTYASVMTDIPGIQRQEVQVIKEKRTLFDNILKRQEESRRLIEMEKLKQQEAVQEQIDGLKMMKDAQEAYLKATMSTADYEKLQAKRKVDDFRKEAELMAKLKSDQAWMTRTARSGSYEQMSRPFFAQAEKDIKEFEKLMTQTPLLEEAKAIKQGLFKAANPQAQMMEQAQRIADMINGGMLTMQQGSAELARVMQENTNATQQQSYDLPRTLQAGTVEAYQAMFGRDNTAKLQLAEQKRQVAEQQKANGLLNDLLNKNPIKAMN
jgi:tape measure domain-containing protein